MPHTQAILDVKQQNGVLIPQPHPALPPMYLALLGVTAREAEVVGWVAKGLTNKSIALRLQISPRTVQKHLERMFRKLGVRSRSELVARVYLSVVRKGNE